MQNILDYSKVILPIVAIILLFAFRNYFLENIGRSGAMRGNGNPSPEYYEEFDFSSEKGDLKGTLLEFGANTCSACKRMKSVLEKIDQRFGEEINIEFHDITTQEGLKMGKQFNLMMIPMQVLINKKGSVVFTHTGVISEEELSDQIKKSLN